MFRLKLAARLPALAPTWVKNSLDDPASYRRRSPEFEAKVLAWLGSCEPRPTSAQDWLGAAGETGAEIERRVVEAWKARYHTER
jgi:hypothetical protein